MYYYKFIGKDGNVTYQAHNDAVIRDEMVEITENDYNNILEEFRTKAENEIEKEELSKEAYIKELENENAGLLFRILTGEELSDA